MSLWKRGRQYWTDFTVAGRRYRKRLGTTNLRVATRRERELIDEAGHGRLAEHEQGPRRLSAAIDSYLTAKRIRCSPRTIELEEERLSLVTKHFGDVPLSAITAKAIAEFQRTRHNAGIANRTINMDVGVLSRVLKSCGRWRPLADHVKNLPERQRPVGRALTAEERKRLFDAGRIEVLAATTAAQYTCSHSAFDAATRLAERQQKTRTGTAAARATKTAQRRATLTPSSKCPTSSRHSHVTV